MTGIFLKEDLKKKTCGIPEKTNQGPFENTKFTWLGREEGCGLLEELFEKLKSSKSIKTSHS